MYVPIGVVKQGEIAAKVEAVRRELSPEVVNIRYELDTDWSGDWAIFFRVLLSDDASRAGRLRKVTEAVSSRLSKG